MMYEVTYRVHGKIKFDVEAPSVDEAEYIVEDIWKDLVNNTLIEDLEGEICTVRTKKEETYE